MAAGKSIESCRLGSSRSARHVILTGPTFRRRFSPKKISLHIFLDIQTKNTTSSATRHLDSVVCFGSLRMT